MSDAQRYTQRIERDDGVGSERRLDSDDRADLWRLAKRRKQPDV
jgi:hypothetical protein